MTPVTRGDRYILKFIYTSTFDKTPEFFDELEFATKMQENPGVPIVRNWNKNPMDIQKIQAEGGEHEDKEE